jgi:hypothetical protein
MRWEVVAVLWSRRNAAEERDGGNRQFDLAAQA